MAKMRPGSFSRRFDRACSEIHWFSWKFDIVPSVVAAAGAVWGAYTVRNAEFKMSESLVPALWGLGAVLAWFIVSNACEFAWRFSTAGLQNELQDLRTVKPPPVPEFAGFIPETVGKLTGPPYACIRVIVRNGPVNKARGRIIGIEHESIPSGDLQWSSAYGGSAECSIDTEAVLDVATVEHANWLTLIYLNVGLRQPNRVLHELGWEPSEYVVTVDFGAENASAVRTKWRLSLSVPHRTQDKDGAEQVWMTPDWLPSITFQLLEAYPYQETKA